MKTKFFTIAILLMGIAANSQIIKFTQEDEFHLAIWNDPTFDDPGFQTGIDLEGRLSGLLVRAGISYADITPEYFDFNVNVGTSINIANIDWIIYSIGGRGGVEFREKNPYPFVGLFGQIDFDITRDKWFKIGLRAWVDHRESQKNQFYGDSDAYKPGLIFKSPLSQENAAVVFTFKIN